MEHFASPSHRLACLRARAPVLALCAAVLLLAGCAPRAQTLEAPPVATVSRDEALWSALGRIEREAFAHVEDNDKALRAIEERAAPGSAEALEALQLRLALATHRLDADLTEQLARRLDAWPPGALRRAAELAAAVGRASLLSEQGNSKAARKALPDLRPYADAGAPLNLLIRAYVLKGLIDIETSAADRAIAYGAEAIKLSEQSNEPWRRAYADDNASYFYFQAQQVELARKLNEEALALAEADGAPALLFHIYNNRGIYYEEDVLNATQADAMALKYARQAGDPALLSQAVANSADAFLRQRKFGQALVLATEGLTLSRAAHHVNGEIVAHANIGLAKIGLGRIDEGKAEVKLCISMFESRGEARSAAGIWEELGNALEAAGDYAGAVEALHNFRRQYDPLMQDDTRKAIVEEQERIEDERRDREALLLSRDNSLKSEQLRQHDLLLKLWLVLAGCIAVSGVLVGLAVRRIRRTNEDLASANASLKAQSEHDSLTGLANRRHFQSAVQRLSPRGRVGGSVFLIDIDHFKRINDQHGHAAGDAVLVEVARRLRSISREGDLVVRWGGEEFVVVVQAQDGAAAKALAQRLLDQIAEPEIVHGRHHITITASIGFATFPLAPNGLELPWERAVDLVDTLMYIAKAHGRNRAYGLDSADAGSEGELQGMALRLESAWQDGRVAISILHGPMRDRAGGA